MKAEHEEQVAMLEARTEQLMSDLELAIAAQAEGNGGGPVGLSGATVTPQMAELRAVVTKHQDQLEEDLKAWARVEVEVGKQINDLLRLAASVPALLSGDADIYSMLGNLKGMLNVGKESLERSKETVSTQAGQVEEISKSLES